MRILVIISLSVFLTACAAGNLTAVHKRTMVAPKSGADASSPFGVFIDAKQRAVLSNTIDAGQVVYQYDQDGNLLGSQFIESSSRVVCAEPSPDALAAIAASTGVSFSDLTRAFSASNSVSEAAGNIGLRTQTIQSMRDGYYRVCEAYMNGLDKEQYAMMLRRFQTNTIALLAIEQLTGTVTGPDLALSSTAGAPLSEKAFYEQRSAFASSVKTAREEELNKVQQQLTPLNTQKQACEAVPDDQDPKPEECSDTKVAERNAAITQLEKRETELKKQRDDAEEERRRLTELAAGAAAATPANATAIAASTRFSTTPTSEVADAVEAITLRVLNQDYGVSMCVDYLRVRRAGGAEEECKKILAAYTTQIEANADARLRDIENRQIQLLQKQALIDDQIRARSKALGVHLDNITRVRDSILSDGEITEDEFAMLKYILGPNASSPSPSGGEADPQTTQTSAATTSSAASVTQDLLEPITVPRQGAGVSSETQYINDPGDIMRMQGETTVLQSLLDRFLLSRDDEADTGLAE